VERSCSWVCVFSLSQESFPFEPVSEQLTGNVELFTTNQNHFLARKNFFCNNRCKSTQKVGTTVNNHNSIKCHSSKLISLPPNSTKEVWERERKKKVIKESKEQYKGLNQF
jgi:hypothetical protein